MTEANKRSFNEQAYLIYHWFYKQKAKLYTSGANFGSRINNAKLKNAGTIHKIIGNYTVSNFVPRIMKKSKVNLYKDFLDLETKKVSALVPYVKLYKVDGKRNVPFYFPVSTEKTDIHTLLRPGSSLGGVGIRNFSMDFQGKDPFMRDKNILCSLSIYMDSVEVLFKTPPPGYAPLAELITISRNKFVPLKEGLSKEVSNQQLNKATSHEIAADVGYSIDDSSGLFTMEERSAIRNTNLFLRLTLTDHSIELNPDGTAVINAKYIGRLSGTLQSTSYNALFQSPDFLALSSIISDQKEATERETNSEKKKEKQKKLKSEIRDNTTSRLRGLFEYLDGDLKTEESRKQSRIHSLKASAQNIAEYSAYVNKQDSPADMGGQLASPPEDKPTEPEGKNLDESAKGDANKNKKNNYLESGATISYIYMGDLVESFIFNTRKNLLGGIGLIKKSSKLTQKEKESRTKALQESLQELETFKVLFGNVVFPLSDSASVSVSLADVPIALPLLQKYFFERIQQTYTVKYTLNNFLEDLVGKVYPMLLKEHLYRDAPNMDVKGSIKSMMISGEDSSAFSSVEIDIDNLPDFLKRRNSLRRKEDDVDCMIIFTEISPDASVGLGGDISEDIKNGVYHMNLGKDRGLLKGINFSQVTQKYRKEALMLESVSLYDELKMPYNAQISMVGNNLFLPGSTIYINPSSIGFGDPRNQRSAAARLGLGGYYVVTSVSTNYSNGQLQTSLTAVFNSWPDSDRSMTPPNAFGLGGIYDAAVNKFKRRGGGGNILS